MSADSVSALVAALAGRTYSLSSPYEVSREKLREFAVAVGEAHPVFHESDAAVAAGFSDVVAPPTFPIVVTFKVLQLLLADPDLAIDLRRVVHGDQRFVTHSRLCAGDVVDCATAVSNVRTLGGNVMVSTTSELTRVGQPGVAAVRAEATLLIAAGATSG
ncbi:MAG TPA: MaoC family dehydratase N-terminal domain-containing protein [Mycobacteriales bacterium]|nr:MaoC family dehydratase N-terminal domain-containing protein [Mycobacteriales bacterium]